MMCGMVVALVILLVLGGFPLVGLWLILNSGKRLPGRRGQRRIGAALLLAWCGILAAGVIHVRPWRSGAILAQGISPDGREYCVVQRLEALFDYRVSFYIRDARGTWQWNYLAHDDDSWQATTVEFTAGAVRISREGILQKEIPREGTAIGQPSDAENNNYPSSFTVAEVAAFHPRRFH